MSEISVISDQYEKLISTSDKINNSIITIKKKSLLEVPANREKYPRLFVSSSALDEASGILVEFVESLQRLIKDDQKDSEFIPVSVAGDYKKLLSGNPYILEDLGELHTALKKQAPISQDGLVVLDTLLSTIDQERSTLFRKLRRARG